MTPAGEQPLRRLIVNADDFGQTRGINEGVVRCFEQGVLTSASVMVRWPYAVAAAEYGRSTPRLAVGLHIDLGEWELRNGHWRARYTVVPPEDASAVAMEVARQLEEFRRMFGTDPTHLDSHQHVHRSEPAASIVHAIGRALGIPVRHRSAITYEGAFYGHDGAGRSVTGGVSSERLVDLLQRIPHGVTELACHPGLRDDAPGMYVAERSREVEALCDPAVRAALHAERIELISFRDVADLAGAG